MCERERMKEWESEGEEEEMHRCRRVEYIHVHVHHVITLLGKVRYMYIGINTMGLTMYIVHVGGAFSEPY